MADPITISTVLGIVGNKVLGILGDKVSSKATDALLSKLSGDPAQKAFKKALGSAIKRYATGERLMLAHALLEEDGFLTDTKVIEELGKLLSFGHEVSPQIIGDRWKASLINPPKDRDFVEETRIFLRYLENELRVTEVFRPVFDSKSLNAIADSTAISQDSLKKIETELAELTCLMTARFGELTRAFAGASFNIRDEIRDYTRLIEEKTRSFVGRKFAFDAIARFSQESSKTGAYLFIRGDPGIGKSALAAQLVKTQGYVHHFNIRAEGVNKAEAFLKNICAQLIAVYALKHDSLPPDATQDSGFLNLLLTEVSNNPGQCQQAIIVIDALDEVDNSGEYTGVNTLYLPVTLPPGILILATMRKGPMNLRIDCEQYVFDIEHDSPDNVADIREYIRQELYRPGIQEYITSQHIPINQFTELLTEKSQGNFMYLHYVLPEIGTGAYKALDLRALPIGLENYYEDHWKRMRNKDEEGWFNYKLPVLMALTVVREPISIDQISDFAVVQDRSRIRTILQEWRGFLHEEHVELEGRIQKYYSVYHSSFHDFIAKKEEIEDERVSRLQAHKKIADKLWSEIFEDG